MWCIRRDQVECKTDPNRSYKTFRIDNFIILLIQRS